MSPIGREEHRRKKKLIEPRIGLLFLNWNGKNDTIECIDSLKKQDYRNFLIVIVDNGSTDGSQEYIKRYYPDIKLIENEKNLGYPEGMNNGLAYLLGTDCEYILTLNNDMVFDSKLLDELLRAAEQYPGCIFTAKQYYYDNPEKIHNAGGFFDIRNGRAWHKGIGDLDTGNDDTIRQVDYAGIIFAKKDVFKNVGLLEQSYFMYVDDTEWSIRAKRMGYMLLMVPTARIFHKVGQSIGGENSPLFTYYSTRNMTAFMKKYSHTWNLCVFIVRQVFLIVNDLQNSHKNFYLIMKMRIRGNFDGIIGNMGKARFHDSLGKH